MHLTGNINKAVPQRIGLLVGRYKKFLGLIAHAGPTVRWIRLNSKDRKKRPHQNFKKSALVILIAGKHKVVLPKTQTVALLTNPGDYIFLPPRTLHGWECLKNDTTLIAITWR